MQLKPSLTKHLTLIWIFWSLSLSTVTAGKRKKLRYEIPTLEGCEIIGHSNATINECGYCVGGETGLDSDYGKDCEGTCFGDAIIDCLEVCGGNAYIDECTGICMTSDLAIDTANRGVNGSIARDCRGLCIPPELSRPQQQAYDNDECGVCRLQTTDMSAFVDCNGKCQSPGTDKLVPVCGQCVEKSAQVMDDCGNCRNQRNICACDRDATICGCNDPNNCYAVRAVMPRAIPEQTESKLLLLGYFHPVVRNLNCLLENEVTGDVLSFPVSFIHKNKTALECPVFVSKEGSYVISLGILKNSINSFRKDFIRLIAYNPREVTRIFNDSEMNPKNISTSVSNQTIALQFSEYSNSLFGIPFRCQVLYSKSNATELTAESNQLHSCSLNPSELRSESQIVYITPTFDGMNPLSKPFELNITAPFPQISHQNCYVSEDGLAVVIIFEKSVRMAVHSSPNTWKTCQQLLTNDTIDYLSFYGLKSCQWTTRVQLIISVDKPISEKTVHIKFNKHVLRESDQWIAMSNNNEVEITAGRLSAEPSWWSYEPLIAITGPSEIPDCGIFALNGHYSSPRGTHDVKFHWEVEGEVSSDLKEHVTENGKSTNLILSAEFFEYHQPYKFVFKAFIPVKEQTLEIGHTLVKLHYDSPLVSIYHTRLMQSTPLYSDQDIFLLADVSVPECVFPVQRIALFWKVMDPEILFPMKDKAKRHSISYEIKPNSYPIEKPVDVYLNAFLGHRYNETSGARFTFVATKAPLTARIANGSTKITVGSLSGMLKLTSKSSKSSRGLVYQWSCHDSKTAQPCYYNFGASNQMKRKDPLLIDRQLQRQPHIELDASALQPNRKYWFGLQVFDRNNRKVFSETEYTLVKVIEGSAPQVFVGPVYIKGEHFVPYDPRLSTHLVPERTSITVKGIVRPVRLIKAIRWEAPNGLFDLNWSNEQIGDEIHTKLLIHKSHIHAFGAYAVKLIACNDEDLCSDAETTLMAVQSVTMCELTVEHFTEYSLSIANVEKCNTPPKAAPLTYQLFLADESLTSPLPLSVPQFSGVIKFIGSPILDPNRIARFAAQVCDRFGNCKLYYSASVTIEENANETSAISDLLKIAKRHQTAGDSIQALSVLGTALIRPKRNAMNEKVINDSIEYSRHALELTNQILTDGHLTVVYSTLGNALLSTSDTKTKRKLIALIQKYTQKAIALKTLPKLQTIKTIYANLVKTFIRNDEERRSNFTYDNTLLEEIRNALKELRAVAASQLPLGETLTLTSHSVVNGHEVDNAVTQMSHSYRVYDTIIRARMDANTTVEAKINFGEEVKQNFSNFWNCNQQMLCQSVVFSATIYPGDSPFPEKEYSHRLSPIIELSLYAPNTGKEQEVRGLFKAATFQTTITGNASEGGSDMITLCHYFDEHWKRWRIDDVHPLGIAYKRAGCWSGHLSTFVVLRTIAGISANYVIGVLVACLMGVLVFGIMLVFFVQKKREDAARVEPKASPPVAKPKTMENPRYRQSKPNGIEVTTASQSVLISD